MRSALTDVQKKLVEENHHVIYAVCKKMSVPVVDVYDAGALALCAASQSFKDESERFFSYAYVAVKRAIKKELTRHGKEIPVESLQIISEDRAFEQTDTRIMIDDIIERTSRYLTNAETVAINGFLRDEDNIDHYAKYRAINKLKKTACGEPIFVRRTFTDHIKKEAVDLRSRGYDYHEIKKRTGVSPRTVRLYYRKAGKPFRGTSADVARLLDVDRSTVLRHAPEAQKIGETWNIMVIPKITKTARRSGKCYSEEELNLIKGRLPDYIVAEKIGRTENAVHLKRWRLNE